MHKSTQTEGERPKPGFFSGAASSSKSVLDTFSLSAPSGGNIVPLGFPKQGAAIALKKLQQRAQAKYVTNVVAFPLAQLNSPLQKQYKRSTNCAAEITETPGKYTSLYCNCRWCLVCSRIRTGRLIVGYLPAIEAMPDKWFLTLSRPNVEGNKLAGEIKYYIREATLIQRYLREKLKLEYSSLRKIECTYNQARNDYHPHFHFIFDSQEAAQTFLDQWLSRNPTAKRDKGNLLKKADDKSVVELFKYFTKVVSKSKSKVNGVETSDYRIHLQALDTMFQAMTRVRTFQPCGVIKAVSEDVEPEQSLASGQAQHNHYKWLGNDWVNVETQAALTGFLPSENQKRIANQIVYPAGVATTAPAPATPYFVDKQTGEIIPNELVDLRIMRNSMQYAKIYPELAEDEAKARRKPCNLPTTKCPVLFLIWKDIEQQPVELEPVAPLELAPLPLFAQPVNAPGVAGPVGHVEAGQADARRAVPLPGASISTKKVAPSRKTAARKPITVRIAQEPGYFTALTSDSQLFSLTG